MGRRKVILGYNRVRLFLHGAFSLVHEVGSRCLHANEDSCQHSHCRGLTAERKGAGIRSRFWNIQDHCGSVGVAEGWLHASLEQ